MKIRKNQQAVSELFGTILLLMIAVVVFTILHISVMSRPIPNEAPSVTIIGEKQGENILLIHRGGEPLSLQTKVKYEIGENVYNIVIGENQYLDSTSKEDGIWDIGEILTFNYEGPGELDNLKVKVTVLDVISNAFVMNELLE